MKVRNTPPQNHWKAVIEWIDKDDYLSLNEIDKKRLIKFRAIHSYVNKLNKSINNRSEQISQLKKEIIERKKKMKLFLSEGKGYYEKLEKLKSTFSVSVYYTEGKRFKKSNDKFHLKNNISKEYTQCILKYKTANSKKLVSISFGSKRSKFLSEIKNVNPKWYEEKGKYLEPSEKPSIKKINTSLGILFAPYIERVLKKNYKNIADKNFILNKEVLLKDMGKGLL